MTPTARPPWIRRALVLLASLVALLGLTAGAFALWVHTDAGRRFVARQAERAVNGQIRGTMHIGAVTAVSRRSVHARDVRFLAPDGAEVLVADEVDVTPSWGALLHGRFVSPDAQVRGARLTLRDDAHGALSIEQAFASAGSSPPKPNAPSPIDFERIAFSGVTLVARLHGVPDARVGRLGGDVRVWVPYPGAALRLSAHDLRGSANVASPLPINLSMTSGAFRFDGDSRQRARTDLRAVMGDTHVRLVVNVVAGRDDSQVSARLFLPSDVGPTNNLPVILQASVAASASPNFDFSVVRD